MPRSLRRKSSIMDLSKLARRHSVHPYNLRPRNESTNYEETHLSQSGMTKSRRRRQISSKLQNTTTSTTTQNDTTTSPRRSSPVESPCSSKSAEQNQANTSDRVPPETTTIYVNEDFGKTNKPSSDDETEEEAEAEAEAEPDGPGEDRTSDSTDERVDEAVDMPFENAHGVVEIITSSSEDADLSDGYRRNYSASAHDYQDLVGHSNGFHFGRSASQSAARTDIDLAENLRDFDALATGDGGHNDPNVLEFSVTVLDENEIFF